MSNVKLSKPEINKRRNNNSTAKKTGFMLLVIGIALIIVMIVFASDELMSDEKISVRIKVTSVEDSGMSSAGKYRIKAETVDPGVKKYYDYLSDDIKKAGDVYMADFYKDKKGNYQPASGTAAVIIAIVAFSVISIVGAAALGYGIHDDRKLDALLRPDPE